MKIKNLILSNAPIKVISCIIGYTFWFIFGHAQTVSTELTVPLCFYGVSNAMTIQAPETITIELSAKRIEINSLDLNNLAIHIDARDLAVGKQPIEVTRENLFLPKSIKLIHYSPAQIIVEVQQQNSNVILPA